VNEINCTKGFGVILGSLRLLPIGISASSSRRSIILIGSLRLPFNSLALSLPIKDHTPRPCVVPPKGRRSCPRRRRYRHHFGCYRSSTKATSQPTHVVVVDDSRRYRPTSSSSSSSPPPPASVLAETFRRSNSHNDNDSAVAAAEAECRNQQRDSRALQGQRRVSSIGAVRGGLDRP
jgi:hypothetical protein